MPNFVQSSIPGVFYRRPNPQANEYCAVGDDIRSGDVIGLIEVMKNYFEVKADCGGKVLRFLVEDGDVVDSDQPIAEIG